MQTKMQRSKASIQHCDEETHADQFDFEMISIPENSPIEEAKAPFQKNVNGVVFPLIIKPKASSSISFDALECWARENQDFMWQLMKQHGGILFRGFDCLSSPKEFNDLVEALGNEALPYVGGAAPRTNVYKGVFTSNESPPSEKIPFHHEMAQVPKYPSKIFFYCEIPAKIGGATPILRSDFLYETVAKNLPEFVEKLEVKGVKYTRVLPSFDDNTSPIGRSWQSTFSPNKDEAEQKAKSLGVTLKWREDGNVESVSGVLPAIKPYIHDPTRKVFFNSMVAAYTGWRDSRNDPLKAVTFGDGEPLPSESIEKVRQLMEEVCVVFAWEKNDVLCLDNNLCMHARQPFEGQRRTLAWVAK